MKTGSIFNLFLMALLLKSCIIMDPDIPNDSRVIIKNNSAKDILVKIYMRKYNDTLLSYDSPSPFNPSTINILTIASDSMAEYPGIFKYSMTKDNKVAYVYIFSKDSVEKLVWENIVQGNKVLKRYELDLNNVIEDTWSLNYP